MCGGATPEDAMKLGIQFHLEGLSLSDTVSVLFGPGVDRCRTTVHNEVQKTDLPPEMAETRITSPLMRP